MGKKINRIIYKGKKIGKSFLSELMESFLYLLYISTPPISTKVFANCFEDHSRYTAIKTHIDRLYRKGYIAKIKKHKNIFISITGDFWKIKKDYIKIKRDKYEKGWDGKWRILIYDIPENKKNKRERLRFFLKQLGFGMVQYSCWLSSYDYSELLYDFAKDEKILDYICIYGGDFYVGKSIDLLVEKIWDLRDLFDSYERLIGMCSEAIGFIKTKNASLKEYYEIYHKAYKEYSFILYKDPFLPDKFLRYRQRFKAEDLMHKLTALMAKEMRLKM